MRIRTGIAVAGITALAGLGLTSAPAFADGGPVTASVTIPSSVTLTGLSPTITFPNTPAGGTAVASGAEHYTVSSNDPAGYTLSITPSVAGAFVGQANPGNTIPNRSQLDIAETGAKPQDIPGSSFGVHGNSPVTVYSGMGGPDVYSETWTLNLPDGMAADTYSETFQYLAVGN